MGATFWGDAPLNTKLYYNNERPIGIALSRLIQKPHLEEILVISSDSAGVADGAVLHLSSVLAEMRATSVNVFWYVAYPGSDFRDLGLALRRFLLELWKARDMKIMGEREFVALSFEIACGDDPNEYFNKNLKALGARVGENEILLVLDLQQISSEAQRLSFCDLAKRFLLAPSPSWRACIAVVPVQATSGDSLHFSQPDVKTARVIEASRGRDMPAGEVAVAESLYSEAASLVHPLIVLNQPAQNRVLDYVIQHAPDAEEDLRDLLEREALWRLGNGGVRISPSGMAKFVTSQDRIRPTFRDTIPNGAKILSFQGPQRLVRQISPLVELEKMAKDATAVVDCFATAVAQKIHGDSHSRAMRLLQEHLDSGALRAAGEECSRSLLCYSSQMLLTSFDTFGSEFFGLLENITYGYANYIQCAYGDEDDKIYEASRWLTNLGYVHDQVKGKRETLQVDRTRIYLSAATYLSNLKPRDPQAWAEIRYSEAWQLYDGGRHVEAMLAFEAAAEFLLREVHSLVPSNQLLSFMAQELFVMSLALAPERTPSAAMADCMTGMLADYASHFDLSDVRAGLQANRLLIDAPVGVAPDTVVVASYFDLHTALLVAQALRRVFRRVPKVVLIPGNPSSDIGVNEIWLHIKGKLALVIGAPDTPGQIGELVSRQDPELTRLYQLRLLGNFGAAIEVSNGDNHLYFLSACGLAGNLYAWHAFIDRHGTAITEERSQMDFVLIKELLVIPLATAIETRVFNAIADRLVAKMRNGKQTEAKEALLRLQKAAPSQREQMVSRLDEDLKTSLVEIVTGASMVEALSDAMRKLSDDNLDQNELLSLADFAYRLAAHLHEETAPASTDQRRMHTFLLGFRNQRHSINELRETYLATMQLDARKFGAYAETLASTLRNFHVAAKELHKAPSVT